MSFVEGSEPIESELRGVSETYKRFFVAANEVIPLAAKADEATRKSQERMEHQRFTRLTVRLAFLILCAILGLAGTISVVVSLCVDETNGRTWGILGACFCGLSTLLLAAFIASFEIVHHLLHQNAGSDDKSLEWEAKQLAASCELASKVVHLDQQVTRYKNIEAAGQRLQVLKEHVSRILNHEANVAKAFV